jgi:hypothetical protein
LACVRGSFREFFAESGLSGHDNIADILLPTFSDDSGLAIASISGVIFSPPCFGFDRI